MKSLILGLVVIVMLVVGAPAHAEVQTNASIPIEVTVFVPCAADGAGESVTLTGDLHVLMSLTVNNNHVSFHAHVQPQGVSGTGSVTGDKYQGTGATNFNLEADVDEFPMNATVVNNIRVIGQGPGNNLLVHENFHVTFNADGTMTAFVDNFRAECK